MQHNVPAAFFHLAQYSVCGSGMRRGVFFYMREPLPNTKICITHGNTVCVQHVFHVLVKCFSGEKVWSAVSVRITVNYTRATVAAIFCTSRWQH
jgi:hypothetical protein